MYKVFEEIPLPVREQAFRLIVEHSENGYLERRARVNLPFFQQDGKVYDAHHCPLGVVARVVYCHDYETNNATPFDYVPLYDFSNPSTWPYRTMPNNGYIAKESLGKLGIYVDDDDAYDFILDADSGQFKNLTELAEAMGVDYTPE